MNTTEKIEAFKGHINNLIATLNKLRETRLTLEQRRIYVDAIQYADMVRIPFNNKFAAHNLENLRVTVDKFIGSDLNKEQMDLLQEVYGHAAKAQETLDEINS